MSRDSRVRDVPVALLIFNRPQLTARVIDALAAARPSRVFVVGDGPRSDRPEDEELVRAARQALTRVDWPCEILTRFSDVNLGCGRRVSSGLDWIFSQVDEAIILEDDCVPDLSFFPFCAELLDRFRDDEHVHMISGTNVMEPDPYLPYSYGFSRGYHIWGWATWRRAWRHYDFEMRAWPELRETDWLVKHLKNEVGAHVSRLVFDGTHEGRVRQWDFQWVLSGWLNDAVAVVPSVNLVTNLGYGEGATHMRDQSHPLARMPTRSVEFPLRHPPQVQVQEDRDQAMWESIRGRYPPESVSRRGPLATAMRRRVRRAPGWR